MTAQDLVVMCVRLQRKKLGRDPLAPVTDEECAAMHAVLREAAMVSPHSRTETVNELKAAGLRKKARPFIDRVLRDANQVTELSERHLLSSSIPWVVERRDWLCWLLINEAHMSTRQVAKVTGMSKSAPTYAANRHATRIAAIAANQKGVASA